MTQFRLEITGAGGSHTVSRLPSLESAMDCLLDYLVVATEKEWWLPATVIARDEKGNAYTLVFKPGSSGRPWDIEAIPPDSTNAIIVWHYSDSPEELRLEVSDVDFIIEVPPSQEDSYFVSRADSLDSCHDPKTYAHPTKPGWTLIITCH